ncbi:MAG: hypothetical protein ABIP55_17100 [Tepidisphaeraceae bacterium]
MNLFVHERRPADMASFVRFWSALYDSGRYAEYEEKLTKPLSKEGLESLFKWKNGGKLSEAKRESVRVNYLERLDELNALAPETDAAGFLRRFGGGAIWRIFLLHCWNPSRYPIYDQHVHRAMTYLESGTASEISSNRETVIHDYLQRYLPFHATFLGAKPRDLDRALWAFGKFLKRPGFPLPVAR